MASHSFAQLIAVMECANYLDATDAFSAAARQLNSRFLAGKSVEELRTTLGAANDMSEEDQAEALAEPAFTPPQEQVEADDVLEAALGEVDAATLRQIKAVSVAWRNRARRELCNRLWVRLSRREGQPVPAGVDSITDLDTEYLSEAGRPWEVVVAGRQLPQLARLHGYGFVVDVQAVREAYNPEAEEEEDDADAPLGGDTLRSCIQGEGNPPQKLLLAAVACAASGKVCGVRVQQLRKDDAIDELDLMNSRIGVTGATLLALMLPAAMSVRSLNLTGNMLCGVTTWWPGTYTTEGITKLCKGLKGSAVTSLNLEDNQLGPEGAAAIAEGLKGNTTLQSLKIGSNDIGDEGASALAAVLKETKITTLGIGMNNIGPEGGAALAEGLKGNSTLRVLDLERNELCGLALADGGTYTTEGITKLCEGLQGSAVTSLRLDSNELGPEGGAALIEGIKGNSTLTALSLLGNNLTNDGKAMSGLLKLVEVLPQTKIESLDLANTMFCGLYEDDHGIQGTYTTEAITKLCEALKGSAVTSLDLCGNHIGDEGASALAAVLMETQITHLTLEDKYNLTRQGKQALLDAAGSSVRISFCDNSIVYTRMD